jgi:tRNA G46 methylase TrmB
MVLWSCVGLLESYPGPVAAMSAQFPDPHFKKRHKKRRMVQPSVVQVARQRLRPGGERQTGTVCQGSTARTTLL